jgi:hypothetical protein
MGAGHETVFGQGLVLRLTVHCALYNCTLTLYIVQLYTYTAQLCTVELWQLYEGSMHAVKCTVPSALSAVLYSVH